jgi:hypothetical protein
MDRLLFIHGERTAAKGGATFERRDPFNGSLASVSAAADRAAEAYHLRAVRWDLDQRL